MNYGQLTVRQFIAELEECAKHLPDGLDSLVTSGDFECNYLHGSHEIQVDKQHRTVFIGYEMHETCEDELPFYDEDEEEIPRENVGYNVGVLVEAHPVVLDTREIRNLLKNCKINQDSVEFNNKDGKTEIRFTITKDQSMTPAVVASFIRDTYMVNAKPIL